MNEVFIYILKQVHLTKSHFKAYCISIVQKLLNIDRYLKKYYTVSFGR